MQPDAHESVLIELPSRHAVQAECWNAATLQPLGSAGKASATGAMRPARAGFAITLGQLQASVSVLCQASFVGPARISAVQWRTDGFEQAAQEFHRKSGLLDGGVIMLALFALMTALINRAPVYVLFAVWLVFNLRMGTISAGWDTQWLGAVVPTDWLSASRLLTFAGFYAITGMLFRQLFREELIRFGFDWAMRLVHSISLVLIPAALLFTQARSLPVALIAYALLNFFGMISAPASLAGVQMLTPERLRGVITSMFLAVTIFVGIGLGPTLIGLASGSMGEADGLRAALTLIMPAVAVLGSALASRAPFARTAQAVLAMTIE